MCDQRTGLEHAIQPVKAKDTVLTWNSNCIVGFIDAETRQRRYIPNESDIVISGIRNRMSKRCGIGQVAAGTLIQTEDHPHDFVQFSNGSSVSLKKIGRNRRVDIIKVGPLQQ